MAKGPKSAIDSPMMHHPPVPGLTSAGGAYNEDPALGPKGVDGGFPLKTMDGLTATPGPVDTTMTDRLGPKGR